MESVRCSNGTSPPAKSPSVRILLLSLLAVSVVSLWLFWPALANGFVNWDDQGYVAELVKMGKFSLSSLRWMWTSLQPFYLQPIVWMTHLVDYQIWGLNPVGHHATNWLLHGIYVILVGVLVWMLTGKANGLRSGERLTICAFISLICGIHPLQVESVAWVSARNGLLCSLWMVIALCAYLRAVGDTERRPGWWWTTIALQVTALLTKPFAMSLPLLMLALDFFPMRRYERYGWWRLVREKWLMYIFSALAAIGAIAAQERLEGVSDYRLGARLLVASRGLVFYLWKLIWPAWLSPFYPLQSTIELRNMEFWVPLLICAVVALVAVWQRKRVPLLAATWWSYIAVLLPVSGLIQVGGQAVADRYAYLAMVPVLIAFTGAGLWIWRRCSMITMFLLCAFLSVWLVFLGLQTRRQIPVWHDGLSLWSAVLTRFPDDPRANFNLATALVGLGRLSEARPYAERAVYFSDPQTPQLPIARATLGTIYLKAHLYDAAASQLQQAIVANGSLAAARYNLACAYARLGRLSEAYSSLQELFAVHPEFVALAARDGELEALRKDPAYAPQLAALLEAARN